MVIDRSQPKLKYSNKSVTFLTVASIYSTVILVDTEDPKTWKKKKTRPASVGHYKLITYHKKGGRVVRSSDLDIRKVDWTVWRSVRCIFGTSPSMRGVPMTGL